MNVKNNKRARESKSRLCDTLLDMIAKVGHKGLSVKDLCREAKINRTTFYTHYDNIEDVLYQICEDYTLKIYTAFANDKLEYRERVKLALGIIEKKIDFFRYVINTVNALDLRVLEIVEKNIKKPYTDATAKLRLMYRISGIIGVLKLTLCYNQKPEGETPSLDSIVDLICNIKQPKNTV